MTGKISNGFFNMDDVVRITEIKSLDSSQSYALQKISAFVIAHPETKPENVSKAIKMVNNAVSYQRLAIDMSNFILAHPSENLKTIR
jgi:hypothetical protein